MKKKIIIASNTGWSVLNFFSGLIKTLLEENLEVIVISPLDKCVPPLIHLGCKHIPIKMDSGGKNPFKDLYLFYRFYQILKFEKPSLFLSFTIKPTIYGSIASHFLNIPSIASIIGLGTLFIRRNWATYIAHILYKMALNKSKKVLFLNKEDMQLFVDKGLVHLAKAEYMPGSGIDLNHFGYKALPNLNKNISFLLTARLLYEKGILEYVEAAKKIHLIYPEVQFKLLGFLNASNPSAISSSKIDEWVRNKHISYLGETNDVRLFISASDCIVLPSYREGLPRSLLEGAAMGRPLITTNAIGCKDVVDDGITGLLCKPRDADDLANKMLTIIEMSVEARTEMGRKGREKIEKEFDEKIVTKQYLQTISQFM